MSDHINVMIVDDQAETRLGFALVLRRDPSLRLWGQAGDGKQAVDAVDRAAEAGRTLPDVVLMDVRMPVMDGIDACARICERHPEVRVLILTTYDEDDYAFGGLEAGASGFLLKDVRSRELIDAVHAVAEGDAVLTPRITRAVLEVNVPKVVSGSERERLRRAFRQLTDHEREVRSARSSPTASPTARSPSGWLSSPPARSVLCRGFSPSWACATGRR